MRPVTTITLFITLIFSCTGIGFAQDPVDAARRAEDLRAQLRDVIAKEAELQARAEQIERDLQPENIARSTALIGTTRTDEVREQRRRQLETEKSSVRAQLDQLAISRARLEATIATVEGEADRLRMNAANPQPQANPDSRPQVAPSRREAAPTVRKQRRLKRQRPRTRRHRT
jgi:hypothetical protein